MRQSRHDAVIKWIRTAALSLAAGVAVRAGWRRLRRADLEDKVVVLTGGSRGLGLELARVFARQGAILALLARDEAELARAHNKLRYADATVHPCDVRDEASVDTVVADVIAKRGRIDVLVNAAGVIDVAPLPNLAVDDIRDSIDTHIWGPLHTVRAALPHMAPGSRIVNISSIGGLVSVPHLLSYSVGKHGLTGLSEGLNAELANRGVLVTTVCPGLMRTGSHVKARFRGRREQEFAWFSLGASTSLTAMSSARAARRIVEACREGRPFLILTTQARLLHLFHAAAPNTTARLMQIVSRLLPQADRGGAREEGWENPNAFAPSPATRMGDAAALRNNELGPGERQTYFGS